MYIILQLERDPEVDGNGGLELGELGFLATIYRTSEMEYCTKLGHLPTSFQRYWYLQSWKH